MYAHSDSEHGTDNIDNTIEDLNEKEIKVMEALFFLLLVAVCHGITIDVPKTQLLSLQAPDFKRFKSVDDPNNITSHEIIHWSEVKSGDADDPVIGYKLKVWEVKKIKRTIYKKQGDEVVRLLEETYPKISVIPDGVLTEIITPANEPTAVFPDMQVDIAYQFAVLAFTSKGEGPLSAPVRITLHHRKKDPNLDDGFGNKKETKYK